MNEHHIGKLIKHSIILSLMTLPFTSDFLIVLTLITNAHQKTDLDDAKAQVLLNGFFIKLCFLVCDASNDFLRQIYGTCAVRGKHSTSSEFHYSRFVKYTKISILKLQRWSLFICQATPSMMTTTTIMIKNVWRGVQ